MKEFITTKPLKTVTSPEGWCQYIVTYDNTEYAVDLAPSQLG